jgi:hypothetical protein
MVIVAMLLLNGLATAAVQLSPATDQPVPNTMTVSVDEYPIYDEVVRAKFLTSGTILVMIERMTTTQMLPEPPTGATPAFFEERGFFDGRLPSQLVVDFLFQNRQPARLGNLFAFGVPYRFISIDGAPESEARLPDAVSRIRLVTLVQEAGTIDRLAFSRVGFSPRRNQALVYVANDRPDGSGAGFLIWLEARASAWQILGTEVVWAAQSQPDSGGGS